MISPTLKKIFQQGSRTYFYSSLFFPPYIRQDVTSLYAFVRVADNYVDKNPQDRQGFDNFWQEYYSNIDNCSTNDSVIKSFCELANRKSFDKSWITAFENSMRTDFSPKKFITLENTLEYIFGSAEVIGLMMAKILDVSDEGMHYASMLGRAMQYANFIRDIDEDLTLNRCYFPQVSLKEFNLSSLEIQETKSKPNEFKNFISSQCELYYEWQSEAELGYKYLPDYSLRAIRTSALMYKWTVSVIQKDPFIIYQRKVKPSISRIILTALKQ